MVIKVREGIKRWSTHSLSLAGRILVVNQVILGSIWYMATCATTSSSAIAKITALIRDYIWSGRFDHKTRARIRWATAILPINQGGMQVLDPANQIHGLLTKILIRGMQPGAEPWKVFIKYRVAHISYARTGSWPEHSNWILQPIKKLKPTGSALWRGVLHSWSTIQPGLEQIPPTSPAEVLREPLFGNRFIMSSQGLQWGTDPKTNFQRWAQKGLTTISDIWNEEAQDWLSTEEIRLLTDSHRRTVEQQRHQIIQSIPWQPSTRYMASLTSWISEKQDGIFQFVYHLQYVQQDKLFANIYKVQTNRQLQLHIQGDIELPRKLYQEVRVAVREGLLGPFKDFNPALPPPPGCTMWLVGDEFLATLPWDPKQWVWKSFFKSPSVPFFNYSVRKGYRLSMHLQNQDAWLTTELISRGFTRQHCAKFYKRIWHDWKQRKVSAMNWLTLLGGLPTGEWRIRLGGDGFCQLCNQDILDTIRHSLVDC